MANKSDLLRLKAEYEEEIKVCKDFILTRLENASFGDEAKQFNLQNPFSLDCALMDPDNQIDHSYDVGRMEAFQRALSDINYILAYEA